ncbi:tRNA uridine-5-carboxymethylaminomethyl(34) synthesis GTPase MnmE [Apilactobacillus timberlakei]|uniref:tRNA uridine-5-carboxymethylaminomethyl(34) synthesis GTPase MnmE n=1 Tax=Apilactobacillus timberlakei TaxID=2008380 RepID=UPI00112A7864|nr:tRNA uridine-5-carboxymethylaminomethyl(34) synthesis GTPase MnmE [Apilactobacillus timberlakei]TPR19632.1 tRNA uridine-5-carboxymethylaminomethyl(34) synthesis GTPase MnmE [Apilactobacillus timberlakei]TPR20609.1 tRNA uridine-5-carboxymethylaminomethyl(34) synthesis GTPase MnmE [Apilactobacillus timberlakei]TPR22652.1 tRNA uridine-5-carboxymethylaminomethyl(34) synthesis GTPase MnmE [Apilactobacillus timberlakei]
MATTTDFDTIAAISTPPGEGGISIIRISGEDALKVISKLYRGKDLSKVASHTINYGHIMDPENKEDIDEVMVSVMLAPKTYTCEDVIEINCHGGIVATNTILQLVLSYGARMAEPGEFTKRAFLNGRIDLSQSEAVMDIIDAKTNRSMKAAEGQLDGNLSRLIRTLRQQILDVLANVEVNIDYPEYDDAEVVTSNLLMKNAKDIKEKIIKLLKTSKQGQVLRDGLATSIVGRPNVGKSSILNHLLHQDKAIVTDVPGTTRDVLEEYVNVRGVPLKLVDTAGIRKTEDKVEKIGVDRSRKAIQSSDLVLLVLNSSEVLSDEDKKLIELTDDSKRIVILNKTDLPQKINIDEINQLIGKENVITTSAIKDDGTESLEEMIAHLFFNEGIQSSQADVMVTNARHVSLLHKAKESLNNVISGLDDGMPVDLVQMDMRDCWESLGEITGDSYNGELLDQLFSQFCLGK